MLDKLIETALRYGQLVSRINELYAEKKALEKELSGMAADLRDLAGQTGKTAFELLKGVDGGNGNHTGAA